MRWRRQVRDWTVQRGRQAQRYVHRVSEQALARARHAGQRVAARVLSVQRTAGLPEKMIQRSALSVAVRPPVRESDAAWRQGYLQQAARTLAPQADREAGQ
jgi:hypothetical protein